MDPTRAVRESRERAVWVSEGADRHGHTEGRSERWMVEMVHDINLEYSAKPLYSNYNVETSCHIRYGTMSWSVPFELYIFSRVHTTLLECASERKNRLASGPTLGRRVGRRAFNL